MQRLCNVTKVSTDDLILHEGVVVATIYVINNYDKSRMVKVMHLLGEGLHVFR